MEPRPEDGPAEDARRPATPLSGWDRLALLAVGLVACLVLFQVGRIGWEISLQSPGLGHLFPSGSSEARGELPALGPGA